MKKHLLLFVATMVIATIGCTDQQLVDEAACEMSAPASTSAVQALVEKARQGDSQAYMQLADCYRDGKGVKKDLVGMLCMLRMADEYGTVSHVEDYVDLMPENSEYKLVFDAVKCLDRNQMDECNAKAEQLIAQDSPEGYWLKSMIAVERNDSVEGRRLMELAASQGSTFAEIVLCFSDWQKVSSPDLNKLGQLAERIPFVCKLLAETYAGKDDESIRDERLAAYYYLKADESACLDREGARWLLSYHQNGDGLPISESDLIRFQKLARERSEANSTQSKCQDEVLEAAVSQLLQEAMIEHDCTKGMVYVVETPTGAIKAQVSLENQGIRFAPYEDTFNDEQCVMMTGPTYLALLSSGIFSADDVIETGSGVYKGVRDHNWHRGGYGQISLKQALGCRSIVAFTKACEVAFGNNTAQLDDMIATYLAGMPDGAIGMLTFYNAVANGGRMVLPVTEGDDVIVLNEQIAAPEHIRALQDGLRQGVTHGLYRRAGRDYTTVSACGRSFETMEDNIRMELCGYFPAENPMYTIMVILEKKNRPASSCRMCGPLMAKVIDTMVEAYGLLPVMAQKSEEPQ